MESVSDRLASAGVPTNRDRVVIDARDLPPPEPLQRTLERLSDLDAETVLIQRNDRAPQLLFPKLEDRGYEYATTEAENEVLTAIWRP